MTGLVKDSGKITLAIGDGANDVGMIQAAHIGVGISGPGGHAGGDGVGLRVRAVPRSGAAAARARAVQLQARVADGYLLLLQEHRLRSDVSLRTTWRRARRAVVYNDWLMSAFNMLFVSFPVLALGCFDQDVNQRSCVQFPHLVQARRRTTQCFTHDASWLWALNALYVSVVTYFFVFYGVARRRSRYAGRPRVRAVGSRHARCTPASCSRSTSDGADDQLLDLGAALRASGAASPFGTRATHPQRHGSGTGARTRTPIFHTSVGPTSKYWAGIPLLVAAGLLPDLMYRGLRRALYPEYHHLVQEHEAKHRGRGESKGVSAPGAETGDLESGGGGDDGASPPRRERDDRLARGGVVGVGVGVGVTASPVKPGTLTGATPDPSSAHHTPREETTSLKDYLDQVARGAEEDPDDEGFAWRPRPTRETGIRPPSQFSSRPSSRPPSGGVN